MMTVAPTPIHRDFATESRRSFDRYNSDSVDSSSMDNRRPASSQSSRSFGQSSSAQSIASMSQATPRASGSSGRASFDGPSRNAYVDDALGFDFLLGPAPHAGPSRPSEHYQSSSFNDRRGRAFSPVRGQQSRTGLTFTEEEREGHIAFDRRRSSDDSSTPGSYDVHSASVFGHHAPHNGRERLSSSSVASSTGATSPLSPHVEPFSPATSVTGSLPWATNGSKPPQDNSSSDHRTVTSSQPFSQRSTMQYSDTPHLLERRISALALSESAPTASNNQFSVLSSNSFEDAQGGPYSAAMSASGSRDALPVRRELQADRGGYVRANYSTETASRNYGATASGAPNAAEFPQEEISTIFVVGFPDDMLEREFQNLFLFAEGFEAATLKVPASTFAAREQRDRERPGSDPYAGMLDDDAADFPGSIPFETTLPPLLGPNPPRDRTASPASNRKQTIGFARFRTRAQALQARDMLSGRRVDAERGSVLKAEMAKKNLHTKRSQDGALAHPSDAPVSTSRSNSIVPGSFADPSRQFATAERDGRYDMQQQQQQMPQQSSSRQPEARSSYQEASRDQWDSQPRGGPASPPGTAYNSFNRERTSFEQSQSPAMSPTMANAFPPVARNPQYAFDNAGNKSMMQQFEDAPSSYAPSRPSLDGSAAGADSSSNGRQALYPASAYAAALPPLNSSGIPRTTNPADMNAPKNTLYVGGLPSVLPSLTGPFSAAHLEDSLRNAFARCQGFKRLCFRSKSNGPIVFVEFEDVAYATRALQDMYGHTLGGLVKGGIRLSYSKNPLGVRSSTSPTQQHLTPMMPNAGSPAFASDSFASAYPTNKSAPQMLPRSGQQQQQQQPTAGFNNLPSSDTRNRVSPPHNNYGFAPF